MLKFKSKIITRVVNFFLLIWQLPQLLFPGLIALAIFRNGKLYYNEDAKVLVLNVNKGYLLGTACFSSGPIIFTTPECSENTIKHETGHSVQSIMFGPIFHILVSLPSVILFWTKRILGKDQAWYHSKYPENHADKCGHVDISEYGL